MLSLTLLGCLFFIFGLVSWVNSILVPYFKVACELTSGVQTYLVTFAFYIAYLVMTVPASYLLRRVGYKRGTLIGLWIMAAGALLFWPAALTRTYGAETLNRFNMYNSIGLSIMPATGYSTGDAIRAVEEVAATALPVGFDIDYGSITREESQQGNTTVIIFAICILMIYLVLSGLYESYIIPFAVLLSVPVGLMGSFLFAKVLGLENNIYLQTGLIMLIGLISKTAILLTEYAVSRRQAGMGIIAAAVSAAKVRLRPILMTALTMIVGLLPLTVSTGVGANGNRALGSGVVGGMLVATLAMLFLVPTLFVVFEWLQEKVHPMQSEPSPDWQVQEEIEESEHEKKVMKRLKSIQSHSKKKD